MRSTASTSPIPRGTVYGVLGPNGAGKTTTIRMLATLLRPDAGTARVLGHDVVREAAAVRSRVSLTGQFASVDEDLTGRENLVLLGRLLGHSRRQAKARARRAARRVRPRRRRGPPGRRSSRAACAAGSTSRRASSSRPTCCSSTSRPPASTRAAATRSGRSSAPSSPRARRSCSPPSTSTRPTSSPTGSRSSTTAGSSPRARRAELKASVGAGALRVRLLDPAQREQAERVLAAGARRAGAPRARPRGLAASLPAQHGAGEAGSASAHALAELSRAGIAVSDFALGQPSLDEVFLALTGSRAESETRHGGDGMSDASTGARPGSRLDAPTATALSPRPRPAPASALAASLAFGWRVVLKIKHVPEQLGDVIGIPMLFTLMFTYLFGGALAGSTGDYLQFLLPGHARAGRSSSSPSTRGVTLNTRHRQGRLRPLPLAAGLAARADRRRPARRCRALPAGLRAS